jgi:hypothetical protein
MRVFLSCLQAMRRHPVPAYGFWEDYFKRGMEEGGHEWVEAPGVDWAEALQWRSGEALDAWSERTWPAVVDFITTEHRRRPIDLMLGYFFPWQVDADAIRAIQRLGIPCVNFFCDNVRWFRRVPESYRVFDLHWVPEKQALPMYRSAGLTAVHAPMPCWIEPARRIVSDVELHPPTFIGSRDRQREALLAAALAGGAELEIRGAGWMLGEGDASDAPARPCSLAAIVKNQATFVEREGWLGLAFKLEERAIARPPEQLFAQAVRPAPARGEYEAVLQQSMITIGINRYPSYRRPFGRPGSYSRLRDIEAPMLGACYLTEWTEGLDDLYEIGSEIEVFHDVAELVEKIAMLRGDPGRRRSLREAGQRRALAQYTVHRTMDRIALALGTTR